MLMVTAEGLNFRSTPDSASRANILAVLSRGHPLVKTGEAPVPNWIAARTELSGGTLQGFVNGLHTGPLAPTGPSVSPTGSNLPPADRGKHSGATRTSTSAGMRTYQLGEADQPGLPSTHGSGRAAGIVAIVNWLDCGRNAHGRWWPAGQTFCNIYTYDVCALAGGYAPRVWWNDSAARDLRSGRPVEVRLPATVSSADCPAAPGAVGRLPDQRALLRREGVRTLVADRPHQPTVRLCALGGHLRARVAPGGRGVPGGC
jgi:hypothetical protein